MKKLLLAMTLLIGFAQVQAYSFSDLWNDFKDTSVALGKATKDVTVDGFQLIKSNTWDKEIGSCKNGGKIVCGTLATIIIADQLYCWYVNREIMKAFNARKQLAHTPPVNHEQNKPKTPTKKQPKKGGK